MKASWICCSTLAAALLLATSAHAQQSPAQPIELPEFIVTGKEQVGVPGATKQPPVRPPMLPQRRLDSLNPVEKLPLPPLPEVPLPMYRYRDTYSPGHLVAEIGNYLTPNLQLGYSLNTGGYLVDLIGEFEASDGWVEGAEYLRAGGRARSSYVAPEKFIVFGGSLTTVDLGADINTFRLFAIPSTPERSVLNLNADVATSGSYEGVAFDAKLGWNTASVSDASNAAYSDAGIHGSVSLSKRWEAWDVGVTADVRLPSFYTQAYPYSAVGGRLAGRMDSWAFSVNVAPQWAGTSFGADRFGVGVQADVHVFLSSTVSADVSLQSGLRHLRVADLLKSNPYLADYFAVDVPYDIADVRAVLRYHPTVRLTVAGGLQLRTTDRDLVWVRADTGTFISAWLGTTTIACNGNVRWLASAADAVSADLTVTSAALSDTTAVTYVPTVMASATHERDWTEALRSNVTIVYVGDRYADVANLRTVAGYVDVQVAVMYNIAEPIIAHIRAENLVGNTMVLWEGYRERGVFVSAGLTWRF